MRWRTLNRWDIFTLTDSFQLCQGNHTDSLTPTVPDTTVLPVQDNPPAEVPASSPRRPIGGLPNAGPGEHRAHWEGGHHSAIHGGGGGLQSGGDVRVL